MKVNLISCQENPVVLMASAAAATRGIRYADFIKDAQTLRQRSEKLLLECYESGHWSVFEFCDFDIEGEGVSRVFETQGVRSRICSFEFESGRRDQEYEACDIVGGNEALLDSVNSGIREYNTLVKFDNVPAEDARYALPQGVARLGRIKRNFRNLIETAMIRLCSHAQTEYRTFMVKCKEQVAGIDPFLSTLMVPKCKVVLYCNEKKRCCRLDGALTKDEVRALIATTKSR